MITEPQDEAAYIFDQTQLRTFEVELAPEDLATVDASPTAEQYVPAVLTFEGVRYEVGYRYKGSLGAFQPPCTAGFGAKAGKCSIKLSLNWMDPEGRFFGLKKLQFHAMNVDPSMLRERLGYAMFREHGVPAPRAVHAILKVNGQPQLFALIEQIDGRFTRSRFTEGGEGNLYKEIWPIHTDAQAYLAALKTNEDESPSVDRMLRFEEAVRSGPEALEAWVDRDVLVRQMAVDRVILNDDGIFHLYCFVGAIGNNPMGPANHNYYWYEEAGFDRFWLIPWDLDHSMNEAQGPAHIPVDWCLPQDASMCGCEFGVGFGGSVAAGCDPVFKNLQAWKADYEASIDEFIAGPFSKENVDAKLNTWRQQIEDAGYAIPAGAFDNLSAILERARNNRGFPY